VIWQARRDLLGSLDISPFYVGKMELKNSQLWPVIIKMMLRNLVLRGGFYLRNPNTKTEAWKDIWLMEVNGLRILVM
jgi:hypothetical protein